MRLATLRFIEENRPIDSPWDTWRLHTLETRMESWQEEYTKEADDAAVQPGEGPGGPVGAPAPKGARHRSRHRRSGGPQLGYGIESVRNWVRQADIDDGVTAGTTTAEAERIKALEQENRELRRANEILSRASAFFAQAELDRP